MKSPSELSRERYTAPFHWYCNPQSAYAIVMSALQWIAQLTDKCSPRLDYGPVTLNFPNALVVFPQRLLQLEAADLYQLVHTKLDADLLLDAISDLKERQVCHLPLNC